MADWNQIVAEYEAKIAALEAKVEAYAKLKLASNHVILITAGVALFIGIVIGASL